MRVIVNPNGSVEWKRKIYLPGSPIDLPEKEAQRLIDKGKVSLAKDDAVIAETPDLEDMTVVQLKKLLDDLEIEFSSGARKDELIALVKTNTAEPPAED